MIGLPRLSSSSQWRPYDHALDPESGSVDEVGGRHQVFFSAPKLVSQLLSNLASAWSCFWVQGAEL